MITEEENKDIEFCRELILGQIDKMKVEANKVDKLSPDVLMTVIYLKIFYSYLKQEKFETIQEAWKFMNDVEGIIEKISYVDNYIFRIMQTNGKK